MRLLYTTDLHGERWKYERIAERAREHRPDVVINGGDLLPYSKSVRESERFIAEFLDGHFAEFDKLHIPYLLIMGNDDVRVLDDSFDSVCRQHSFVRNIAQQIVKIDDYEFIGFNWVVDYPFRLKDRCRMDHKDYVFQHQLGTGILSDRHGWKEIADWPSYAASLPTVEDELHSLVRPSTPRQAVYVAHMPPAFVGLDVCSHGAAVGSVAVHDFIERVQPLLTLHGHIHESPEMTGIWKTMIGETTCIQPGQEDHLVFVEINLPDCRSHRHTMPKPT